MISAGIKSIGDARVENIEAMRRANVVAEMVLIRAPMLSQIDRVVVAADVSFNTELNTSAALYCRNAPCRARRGIVPHD